MKISFLNSYLVCKIEEKRDFVARKMEERSFLWNEKFLVPQSEGAGYPC